MNDLAAAVANVVRRNGNLVVEREVRDVEGERERKARLGSRFEEERQATKAMGLRWTLYKVVREDLGPLRGVAFFANGVPISKRLRDIEEAVIKLLRSLANEELKTAQIRFAIRKLGEYRDELDREFDRLDALAAAFEPDNLGRIVRWSNEQAADEVRREAEMDNIKAPPIYDRYATAGREVTETWRGHQHAVGLTAVYQSPARVLMTTLKDATSVDRVPPPARR